MEDKNKNKKDVKRNALGRGLSALLEDHSSESEVSGESSSRIENTAAGMVGPIDIDKIETNPYQPRTHFDLVALQELADSIRIQGVIQPITVRKLSFDKYQLISGERRLQASKLAGLTKIPAFIRVADDEQMLEMALIENIQREDLNPIEVALGYKRLMEECNMVIENVGEKVGKNRSTVNNYVRLLKLPPEIQIGIRDGRISMGHARALITVEDPVAQLAIYQEAVQNEYSVRKVEELVRALAEKSGSDKKAAPKKNISQTDIHVAAVEKTLEEKFGTKVSVNHRPDGKGEIRIQYFSQEDLNRILDMLEE